MNEIKMQNPQPWELVLLSFGEETGVLGTYQDGRSALFAMRYALVCKEALDMMEGSLYIRPVEGVILAEDVLEDEEEPEDDPRNKIIHFEV